MDGWQLIKTAPRDGTPVLLRGGDDLEGKVLPVVVGFRDPDYAEDVWKYAYWEGGWYSTYTNPTEWHPIPE